MYDIVVQEYAKNTVSSAFIFYWIGKWKSKENAWLNEMNDV